MKKSLKAMVVFLGVMILMSLNSCQKDEDLIVGKWECTKIEKECESHVYYNSGTGDHEWVCDIMYGTFSPMGCIWSFDADGTVDIGLTAFWNINEDVLTIDSHSIKSKSFTIEELTSSEMILLGNKECEDPGKYHWYRAYFRKI